MEKNKDLKILILEDFDQDEEICDNQSVVSCDISDRSSNKDYDTNNFDDEYDNNNENVFLDNADIFDNPDILNNHDIYNENNFYDISIEGEFIPEVDIQIETDDNQEKIVKFILKIPIGNNDESITVDLNITKKTYLMIAEELFKK
jgi:hypothetical protein